MPEFDNVTKDFDNRKAESVIRCDRKNPDWATGQCG